MARVRRIFLIFIFLRLSLLLDGGSVGAAEKKAAVFGTPTANMRAGAGVEQPLKLTLKEGDQVSVEKLEGEWYQVSTGDGQKGYVHKNLLKLIDEPSQQPAPPGSTQKPLAAKTKEPAKNGAATSAPTPSNPTPAEVVPAPPIAPPAPPRKVAVPTVTATRVEPPKTADSKSPSILQMIEGHETELKIAFLIAGIAFLLGWLCGGSYYLRRERKSWRKLRL
jgi:hypothetical protein